MSYLAEKNMHPCETTIPCFYRKNDLCTFRMQFEVMLDYLAKRDPENNNCYKSLLDVISLPCSELNEEELQHGIEDLFKLSE